LTKDRYYIGSSESNSLVVIVDQSYLDDIEMIKEFPNGKVMLSQIHLIEDVLISKKSKRLPDSFKDDLNNDERGFKTKLINKARYKGLGNLTKLIRSEYNDESICLISVKLFDSGVNTPRKDDPLRQNRLTYEYRHLTGDIYQIIFMDCYGHKIYRYRDEIGSPWY